MDNIPEDLILQHEEHKKWWCSAPGLEEFGSRWRVHDFYENQFDDAANFNLDENVVSAVTAVLTSISLLLFADITFRVSVRARKDYVSKQMIYREHVLTMFSNPVTLFCSLFETCGKTNADVDGGQNTRIQSRPISTTSKRTFVALSFTALILVFMEFLFIFFATNRVSEYNFELDQVPIFEFEDRGCEFIPLDVANSCVQRPLTSKAGFDSRASIQICSRIEHGLVEEGITPEDNQHAVLRLSVSNAQVDADVYLSESIQTARYSIGVLNSIAGGSGVMYKGRRNVTGESVKGALLSRIERTNLTILEVLLIDEEDTSRGVGLFQRASGLGKVGVQVIVDMREVVWNETHVKHLRMFSESVRDDDPRMIQWYLHDVMRSIMFPDGRGARLQSTGEHLENLTAQEALVVYNRPWLGIVHSMSIFFVLFLVWVALVMFGVEGGVDARWAWKEFFEDTLTINDFGKGNNCVQQLSLRPNMSGQLTFGYEPTSSVDMSYA